MKARQDIEMSRPLGVDKIPQGGMQEHIVARPAERQALAARFGLIEIPSLEADLSIDHGEGRTVVVTGRFCADVVQQCVVTLEPMMARIAEEIDVIFAPAKSLGNINDSGDIGHVDVAMDEEPEPIINGHIDLGELVAQHMALAINPYPRKAGAKWDGPDEKTQAGNKPFAHLRDVLKKQD